MLPALLAGAKLSEQQHRPARCRAGTILTSLGLVGEADAAPPDTWPQGGRGPRQGGCHGWRQGQSVRGRSTVTSSRQLGDPQKVCCTLHPKRQQHAPCSHIFPVSLCSSRLRSSERPPMSGAHAIMQRRMHLWQGRRSSLLQVPLVGMRALGVVGHALVLAWQADVGLGKRQVSLRTGRIDKMTHCSRPGPRLEVLNPSVGHPQAAPAGLQHPAAASP